MALKLTSEVKDLVKQLIFHISGFDESSEHYKQVEDFAYKHLTSLDYFSFYNRNDIEKVVNNLGEKFRFHGFSEQADAVINLTKSYLDSSQNSDDLDTSLAVIKLLLSVSQSPTNKFIQNPEYYKPRVIKPEPDIDWGTYLTSTKYQIQSFSSSSSEEFSDLSDIDLESDETFTKSLTEQETTFVPLIPSPTESKVDFKEQAELAKAELVRTVQTHWWNSNEVVFIPSSNYDEALVAFRWKQYLEEESHGLMTLNTNIISEYKIIREVIWQFYFPNSCLSFLCNGKEISVRDNISISSVRGSTFQEFLRKFIPYIEIIQMFRNLREELNEKFFMSTVPDTFRSYLEAVKEIIEPFFVKLQEIECALIKQENIVSLLTMMNDLHPYFKTLIILSNIHKEVYRKGEKLETYTSVSFLLSKLYLGLINSVNIVEQNIYLTLYLKSILKYFMIMEIWLTQDIVEDSSNEFIIVDKSTKTDRKCENWYLDFGVKRLEGICQNDRMLRIIYTKVLEMARNVRIMRNLGKLRILAEKSEKFKETLYDEFIRKFLEKASLSTIEIEQNVSETKESESNYAFICPEQKHSKTGIDSIDNYLDMSDGFLTTVFENYLYEDKQIESKVKKIESLYSIINRKITQLHPLHHIIEDVFTEILDSRYIIPRFMFKDIVCNEFKVERYFKLLKHLFLFEHNILHTFYRQLFQKIEINSTWGNYYVLTAQLQVLLMDYFPDLYEICHVDVNPKWKFCQDPIEACDCIYMDCKIDWPITIVITIKQLKKYNHVFVFLLKLKWALFTINNLRVKDIESKNGALNMKNLLNRRVRMLLILRFGLLNDINSINHYVLGHLFTILSKKFETNIEKAKDLESVIENHEKFIRGVYNYCMKIRDEHSKYCGFAKILSLVQELKKMWFDILNIDDEHLQKIMFEYDRCHKFVSPICEIKLTAL